MTAAAECVLQDFLKHAVGVNMFCWASSRDQTAHEQGSFGFCARALDVEEVA